MFSEYDLYKQYRIMECLQETTLPVPQLVGYESDGELLGTPFYVMRYLPGRVISENPPYPWGQKTHTFNDINALVERFILSLKNECTRVILVPLRRVAFRQELGLYADWFNQDRPHSALDGKTPHEAYHKMSPASERPRFEPRARWPRTARCASPHAPVTGNSGAPIRLDVRYHVGRKHLPIVDLRLAA